MKAPLALMRMGLIFEWDIGVPIVENDTDNHVENDGYVWGHR